MDTLKAIAKQLKSYFKTDWEFDNYPTKTWKNPNAGENNIAFGAGIINWPTMVGHGESPEKALSSLKDNFKLYKDNNDDLPRPGTKVPLKFASTNQIDKYEKTAVDYFERILKMDYYEGFYSDGSILAYFEPYDNDEEANKMKKEIIERTLLIYDIDITDIYDEPLWKIFERIENKNKNASC